MAEVYTPEPKVEGDIIANDGKRALVAKYEDNGDMWLLIYEWYLDKRFSEPRGKWSCAIFGTIRLTLTERKALFEALK